MSSKSRRQAAANRPLIAQIDDYCLLRGISYGAFCKAAGIYGTAIIQWKIGSKPRADMLAKVMALFNQKPATYYNSGR